MLAGSGENCRLGLHEMCSSPASCLYSGQDKVTVWPMWYPCWSGVAMTPSERVSSVHLWTVRTWEIVAPAELWSTVKVLVLVRGSYLCTVRACWTKFGQLDILWCLDPRGKNRLCRCTQPYYLQGKCPVGPVECVVIAPRFSFRLRFVFMLFTACNAFLFFSLPGCSHWPMQEGFHTFVLKEDFGQSTEAPLICNKRNKTPKTGLKTCSHLTNLKS